MVRALILSHREKVCNLQEMIPDLNVLLVLVLGSQIHTIIEFYRIETFSTRTMVGNREDFRGASKYVANIGAAYG